MNKVLAACKAVIKNEDKYLLLKQKVLDEYFYDIPGGKVEFGESPYETLKREVMEEVALEVEILKPLGVFWFFRKKDGDQIICSTFLCSAITTEIDLTKNPIKTENIIETEWLTKEEMIQKIDNQSLRELIAQL